MIALRIAAMFACAMLASCAIVPLSRQESPNTRQNIGEAVPAFVTQGVTTRSDVLLTLGEPDGASENARQFVYTQALRTGGWMIIGCSPVNCAGGASEKMLYDRLIFVFDEAGLVSVARHERIACTQGSDGPSCVDVAGHDKVLTRLPGAAEGDVFPVTSWYHDARLSFWSSNYEHRILGTLAIGQSSLAFYAPNADSHSKPIMEIPYAEIADITFTKVLFSSHIAEIVLKRKDGEYDRLRVEEPLRDGGVPDTTGRAGKLIESRWRAQLGSRKP